MSSVRRVMLGSFARALFCALAVTSACSRSSGAPTDAAAGQVAPVRFDEVAIARAEDARRAADLPPAIATSHDVAARRRSARALARIADAASVDGLSNHLSDDDPETLAWAAYGLGYACKGREDVHVRALSARAASLPAAPRPTETRGALELDPRVAIARAIGRCAAPRSEAVLVALAHAGAETAPGGGATANGAWTEAALLGLGDLATRRRQLGADAMTVLLDAAGDASGPRGLAFYALGRAEPGAAFAPRVARAARRALGRPGEARIHAIRALGRAGDESPKTIAPELARVVVDAKGFDAAERAEAARALGALGGAGKAAIAEALGELTPDAKDAIAIARLAGPSFHVLHTLLEQLGAEAPKTAEPALLVLAALKAPTAPKPSFARRLAEIRCAAALALARGAYDADILRTCDAESSETSQRTRLTSLLRRPLVRERLAAFRAFAESAHVRVREQAVEALASHPEVGDAGARVIADALASKHAGLVATAAGVLHAHPERAMVLAEREKRAALDPSAPPPTPTPAQELAPAVAKALSAALAERWPEDRFETRIALVEAAASVRHPQAEEIATRACGDPNPVLRERAQKALRTLGASAAACDAPARAPSSAAELGATLAKPTRIVFTTDAGELAIVLEPELAPLTVTRIASLVRSGFYKGIVIHRVVPGFVVQLGDPDGDGFGGSGTSLRCETSPVAFNRLDVGMALAGRDTGSSQLFVTLSRTPHLDGEYTHIGHAEGDWESAAQGDVILDARVVE